ncbi:LpxL/LpxP family Kdo(2)-lipid IV(A) lauroyl/palmitoleoyl acyltransferase [sulfur-oxidizing endosymbiont of Gigantopelta aegis]|uniref:LpxL/LpxP family Kdo(2)-lipid IV(A) lauroyl/palmitoleoyl acyltransferase n=1 Tax=sulfur-oxidizing endosymbiont of Gigantopelta aegis TaxID=2794934 RepID=UPI0018DDF95D|nr:LpxL/LpxP family Kdo(2)-lipid IV(A) lauroyl/palmitoleoyl acyltransferase [sulfur-oxidizing endosymbiont of Gigantopelta aegis]
MSKVSFPWRDFLAPKFWPSWLGLAAMRILPLLPYRLQLLIGKFIGHLFYRIAKYRREIVQINIALCFPELSTEQQAKLVVDHFHSLGISIAETTMSWWGNEKKLRKLVTFKGFEYVDNALQAGTGAIMLGAHYTTMEISGRLIALDHDLAVSYQKLRNPLFNAVTYNARKRMLHRVFARDEIRASFRYIKQNHLMWIAADQDVGIENSVFVPFMGHIAATQTVPSRMAKITKAPIIPYISRRLDNARGYEIEFFPPVENFPSESLEADALCTNLLIEEQIRKAPEQYLWVHRRFKTRPEGMAKLYRKKPRRITKK